MNIAATLFAASALTLALSNGSVGAEEPMDVAAMAERYMAAYPYQDPETLAAFYTDETVWRDPVFTPEIHVGKDAILTLLEGFVAGADNIAFEHELLFTSGEWAIVAFTFSMRYQGEVVGSSRERVEIEDIDAIAALRFANGKLLEQTDYSDAASFAAQIEAQQ